MTATTTPARTQGYDWLTGLLDAIGSQPVDGRNPRQCPAHNDPSPSLSVGAGNGGRALVFCHAGCSLQNIARALRIPTGWLVHPPSMSPAEHVSRRALAVRFPPVEHQGHPATRGMRLEAMHPYGRHRLLRWRHPVTRAKDIGWETLDAAGAWIPGLLGTHTRDLPLYREANIRAAVSMGAPVYIVESESSVDAFMEYALPATTWAGGASVPNLHRLREVLRDGHVVSVPDNDPPGLECARRVRAALDGHAASFREVLPPHDQDARDLLDAHGPDALEEVDE